VEFSLDEERAAFVDVARNYCRRELAPLVREAERTQQFPVHVFPEMAKLGFLGIAVPAEAGGVGLGTLEECLFIEEIASVAGGFASSWMVQSCIVPGILATLCSDEQKRRYLEPMLRGELLGSFAVTEADAGSDLKAIKTTAVRTADGFILNGGKAFITQGTICDFAVVLAYTDKAKGVDGMDIFIVDKNTKGFSREKLPKNAYRSSETAVLSFDNCLVPFDAVLGDGNGGGMKRIMRNVTRERILVAARSVGIALGAFEAAKRYATERIQFGKPIGTFQAVGFRIAEMATSIEAARLMARYAAVLWDKGRPCEKEIAMAKLFASEAAYEVSEKAMRVMGGYGLVDEAFPVQRFFMDSRVSIATVGSSDIQKRLIARQVGVPCS
jgi:alkylation response protein AidB-like acyl-CoA dehydrogenase